MTKRQSHLLTWPVSPWKIRRTVAVLFSVHIDGFSQLCVSGCLPHPHPAGKTNPVVCGAPLLKRAPAIHAHVRRGEKKKNSEHHWNAHHTPRCSAAGRNQEAAELSLVMWCVHGVGGGGWLYRGMLQEHLQKYDGKCWVNLALWKCIQQLLGLYFRPTARPICRCIGNLFVCD